MYHYVKENIILLCRQGTSKQHKVEDMQEFLKDMFTDVDVKALVTRLILIAVLTFVFYMFFYYAKKRNLQLYMYFVLGTVATLFVLSFLLGALELRYYVYGALIFLGILGLMLFISDINRHIFRLSLRRKYFRDSLGDHYGSEELSKSVSEIVKSCLRLSKTDTGALIVIADHMSDEVLDSGIKINSEITAELIETLFFPKTPLHDGAVIITANKVASAGCYLPLTQAQNLPREFGTRHRAAIGVSSAFPDCTAIVVSEETGIISAMHDGKVKRYLDSRQLQEILECAIGLADESAEERLWGENRQ